MDNAELAYLLGMITGKGSIIRGKSSTDIVIEIPHKNLIVAGEDATLSVKASLDDFRNNIEPLIGVSVKTVQQRTKTLIKFTKNNEDFLIREINRHFHAETSWKEFKVPLTIFSAGKDIKREFLIGLSDVTAHISFGGEAYGMPYAHRVFIQIPVNWYLVADICNLLTDLNIPVHNIDWGHPNMRDGNLAKYNSGNKMFWNKEHQIKVFAEIYEQVGFRIIHKMELLKKLAKINREEWDKDRRQKMAQTKSEKLKERYRKQIGKIETQHYKFYWEIKKLKKKNRPIHPMEDCEVLPEKIRGQHFNHWTEIAEILGYTKR